MVTAAARCGHGSPGKRPGCSFPRGSKRVCFSGMSELTHCGTSDAEARVNSNGDAHPKGTPDALESGGRVDAPESRRGVRGKTQNIHFPACLPDADGGHTLEDAQLPACRTAKGRVRLYRVRSFLTSCATLNNGVSGAPGVCIKNNSSPPRCLGSPVPEDDQTQVPRQHGCVRPPLCAIGSSYCEGIEGGPPKPEESPLEQNNSTRCDSTGLGSGTEAPDTEQMETVKDEAKRRQAELEGRTDNLWRRLQAVQVKQVERHVTQQLRGLYKSPGLNSTRRPGALTRSSAELSRLARSCSEILRTAESSLDSDHTASSSGGDSDSEEDEALRRGGRPLRPLSSKSIVSGKEWQWVESRAWLGSRWVWLQTQVSELEYRIRALTELYTQLRQEKVRPGLSQPETPLRASNPSPSSNSWKSSVGDPNRKWHADDSSSSIQTVPSPPSSAARVRPLLRQRRHKLIRLEDCTALRSKSVSVQCSCEPPAVCVLCAGAPPHAPSDREKGAWMRQTRLDMSLHPVLSMPSDSPLALHSGKNPPVGHQPYNLVQLVNTSTSPWLGRRGQGRVGRVRRKFVCPRPPTALPPLFNTPGGSGCRSQRGVISPNCLPHRVIDLPTLPHTSPAVDTPAQPLRRRRTESSFDIDNLVMPQGLAGLGARVQKIQYKEIITPSWRELDSLLGVSKNQERPQARAFFHKNTYHQPNEENLENEEEVEDLCDAVFLNRHAVCESRERSRWGSWARRRRRGRSSSSYHGDGKSSRGLEQTPGSPDFRQSHFTEGDVSPRSPFCTGAEDPFSQAEDEQQLQAVMPWERRLFPLQDSEFQWLQEEEEAEPEEDPCTASGRSQSTDSGISVGSLELSPRTPQPYQQHSGTEQTTPHSLSYRQAAPTTVSKAQDSLTLNLSSYPS